MIDDTIDHNYQFDRDYTSDDAQDDERRVCYKLEKSKRNNMDYFEMPISNVSNSVFQQGETINDIDQGACISSTAFSRIDENHDNRQYLIPPKSNTYCHIITPNVSPNSNDTEKQNLISNAFSVDVEDDNNNNGKNTTISPSTPQLSDLEDIDLTLCSIIDETPEPEEKEDPETIQVFGSFLSSSYFQPPPPSLPRSRFGYAEPNAKYKFHLTSDAQPEERDLQKDVFTQNDNDQITYEELSFSGRSANSDDCQTPVSHRDYESYYSKDQRFQDRYVRIPSSPSIISETSSLSMKKPSTLFDTCMEQNTIFANDLHGLLSAECRYWGNQAKIAAGGLAISAYHTLDEFADEIVMVVCPVEQPVKSKRGKRRRKKDTRRFVC